MVCVRSWCYPAHQARYGLAKGRRVEAMGLPVGMWGRGAGRQGGREGRGGSP